jgi:hypothetical protein
VRPERVPVEPERHHNPSNRSRLPAIYTFRFDRNAFRSNQNRQNALRERERERERGREAER